MYKKFQNYHPESGYPVMRRNQFMRTSDRKWLDSNGTWWMRARAFVPPFAETIADETVQAEMTVEVPESAPGALQFWFLLKANTPFTMQEEEKVTFGEPYVTRTITNIIYKCGRRTGLAELS